MTATKIATDSHSEPGIRKMTDALHAKAPWQLTIYFRGKKTRTYHRTLTAARAARVTANKVSAREGSSAHAYDRRKHAEYEAAKKLIGDASLVEVAKFFADRTALGTPEAIPSVAKAVEHLLEAKRAIKRSDPHVTDLETRLGAFSETFGARSIATITRNEILDWLLALKGSARSTSNTYSAVLNLFRHADRRGWLTINPTKTIMRDADLPEVRKGRVGVLTIAQAHGFLRVIEQSSPRLIHGALVRYFAGIRSAEAERFHGEWIDTAARCIRIPGWFLDGDSQLQPGSKTRDDWIIDGIAPAFWAWMEKYPPPAGLIPSPCSNSWKAIKRRLRELPPPACIPRWPSNALRHSFATYDLSAHRDQNATALKLRHQSARKLWSNYLGTLIPAKDATTYFEITPSQNSARKTP